MTLKQLNDIIGEYIGADMKHPYPVVNNTRFREIVPIIAQLALEKRNAYNLARQYGNVVEALTNATGVFAVEEPEALDEPLLEIREGVFNSVVTIDGEEYRFSRSIGDPKRTDGSNITQGFKDSLPDSWVKVVTKTELDKAFLKTLTAAQLKARGLYLPDKYTWNDDV